MQMHSGYVVRLYLVLKVLPQRHRRKVGPHAKPGANPTR